MIHSHADFLTAPTGVKLCAGGSGGYHLSGRVTADCHLFPADQ
jgi:hypothetical protein